MGKQKKVRKQKSNLSIFLKTMVCSLIIFTAISGAAIYGYSMLNSQITYSPTIEEVKSNTNTINYGTQTASPTENANILTNLTDNVASLIESINQHTNFLIVGTDDGGTRADTMMIGSFNADTVNLDLISIPRDTVINLEPELQQKIRDDDRFVPTNGYMQMNEVLHYSGEEHGIENTIIQLETMFNIDLEYYVVVDLDAFVYLVDAIGGVEFNVPERMYYTDPYQDLYIDLQPGLQVLSGKKAEGMVRYRSYGQADLKRIQVQQDFMYVMISQLLSTSNIMNTIPAMIDTMITYVDTNFKVSELTKYLKYVKDLTPASINTHTIPYYLTTDGNKVKIDYDESEKLINQIFYNDGTKREMIDIMEKKIQVLNGSNVTGLAGITEEILVDLGYNVVDVGNSTLAPQQATVIILAKDAYDQMDFTTLSKGKIEEDELYNKELDALINMFPNHEIILDSKSNKSYDIIISLGLDN